MTVILDFPNEEMLEAICDAFCNRASAGPDPDVRFYDVHEFNAINHRFSGSIRYSGHTYGFVIQNGDWNGTEVLQWSSDPEDVALGVIDPPEPKTFVPSDSTLSVRNPGMFAVYCQWRKEPWFKEKVGAMNYDLHFDPCAKTRQYYEAFAQKKGLSLGFLSGLSPIERDVIAKSGAGQIGFKAIVKALADKLTLDSQP